MEEIQFLRILKDHFSDFFSEVGLENSPKVMTQLFESQSSTNINIIASALQILVTDLQKLLADHKGDSGSGILISDSDLSGSEDNVVDVENDDDEKSRNTGQTHLVQIQADNSEIDRRIQAFVEKKRIEANSQNIREFCNISKPEIVEESCARTDAVYITGLGGKSHVRVTRVTNPYGPQTLVQPKMDSPQKGSVTDRKRPAPGGLEERLTNMEEHLGLSSGGPIRADIYERLQKLENKILHLESLSPEYFTHQSRNTDKRMKLEMSRNHPYNPHVKQEQSEMKLGDIDQQIYLLKQSLLSWKAPDKDVKVKSEPD